MAQQTVRTIKKGQMSQYNQEREQAWKQIETTTVILSQQEEEGIITKRKREEREQERAAQRIREQWVRDTQKSKEDELGDVKRNLLGGRYK